MNELINEYQKWAENVSLELHKNEAWIEQYKAYAHEMINNEDKFKNARMKFRKPSSLHYYLTIGKAKSGKVSFDIRYLGQSVGKITVDKNTAKLSVSDTQNENSKKWFNYTIGRLDEVDWATSEKAKEFRRFFKCDEFGTPRQREHMVESALFSEFEKKSSIGKTLKGIQPVNYAGVRIHMKTAVSACLAGKKEEIRVSNEGGEIDCLCRKNVKPSVSRLVAIEIKDENKKNESFDIAMKQAITYAVFLRELIRSDAGEEWKELWGMKNQYKTGVVIDAAVAMPKGDTVPGYKGKKIELKNDDGTIDSIELHSIEITSKIDASNAENVVFETSYL